MWNYHDQGDQESGGDKMTDDDFEIQGPIHGESKILHEGGRVCVAQWG